MQPGTLPPQSGKIAFRWGLIFGLIQTVVAACILLINTFASTTASLAFLLSVLSSLAALALYFVSGILASRQTGKVSTGTLAGMWTGIVYGVINTIISLIVFFEFTLPKVLNTLNASNLGTQDPSVLRTGAIIGGVGAEVVGALLALGLGAGLGALGGLVGRSAAKAQPIPVVLGYPVYPDQPNPYAPPPPAPYQQSGNPQQPGSDPYMEQPR